MTIDEAIQRYEEAVQWEQYSMRSENIKKAAEHRQLAEWLKELKRLRAEQKIIRCKECLYYYFESNDRCYCNRIIGTLREKPDSFCSFARRNTNGCTD